MIDVARDKGIPVTQELELRETYCQKWKMKVSFYKKPLVTTSVY